jgi:hypothetical protein
MVGLTIAFPQMVMHYKGTVVDPADVEFVLPPFGGGEAQPGVPNFGLPEPGGPPAGGGNAPAPAAPPANDLSAPPSFGEKPAEPTPPANDLSQPPKFN